MRFALYVQAFVPLILVVVLKVYLLPLFVTVTPEILKALAGIPLLFVSTMVREYFLVDESYFNTCVGAFDLLTSVKLGISE